MPDITPLTAFVERLSIDWKWSRSFEPPRQLAAEYQQWHAAAERAETDALLRYWAMRAAGQEAA